MSDYKIVNIGGTWADCQCFFCEKVVCVDMEDRFEDVHVCGDYNILARIVEISHKVLASEIDIPTYKRLCETLDDLYTAKSFHEKNQMQINMWFPNE